MHGLCCRTANPLTHLACPFRIMCIASSPWIVRRAACTSRNPCVAFHASCDRSVIRLHDGVHVVDRSGAATALPDAFLLHAGNRRPVAAGSVRVDDAGPRMRRIRQRLAEQAVGHRGSAPPGVATRRPGVTPIDPSASCGPP